MHLGGSVIIIPPRKMDLWYEMNVNGDGYTTGAMSDVFVPFPLACLHYSIRLTIIIYSYLAKSYSPKANSSQQITRLEIVQELSKSFVNRAIGYSTSIQVGLDDFNS